VAIAGPRSIYSHAMHGSCSATGNRFQLKFARMLSFGRVPPYYLILYSDRTPLSFAQLIVILNSLFCLGYRVTVSRLELTFDLGDTSVEFLRKHVLTRAEQVRSWCNRQGRRTFYVGRPTSKWQVRIYVKTATVTRFEFMLRRAELRRLGIR
jgi:hypothetical protein